MKWYIVCLNSKTDEKDVFEMQEPRMRPTPAMPGIVARLAMTEALEQFIETLTFKINLRAAILRHPF